MLFFAALIFNNITRNRRYPIKKDNSKRILDLFLGLKNNKG